MKQTQEERMEGILKRPIPKKKIGIVHLEMVKEGRSLYGMERFTDPQTAAAMVRPLMEKANREMLVVMSLDAKLTPMALEIAAVGGLNVTHIQMRDLFQHAILNQAHCIMCFHNHPSGDPEPSREDHLITERIYRSGMLLGIELVDHIILGEEGRFYSFREAGILPIGMKKETA